MSLRGPKKQCFPLGVGGKKSDSLEGKGGKRWTLRPLGAWAALPWHKGAKVGLVWTLRSTAPLGRKVAAQPEFNSPLPPIWGPQTLHLLPTIFPSLWYQLGNHLPTETLFMQLAPQLPPKAFPLPSDSSSALLGPFQSTSHDGPHCGGVTSFRVHAQWKAFCTRVLGLPPSSRSRPGGSSAISAKWI